MLHGCVTLCPEYFTLVSVASSIFSLRSFVYIVLNSCLVKTILQMNELLRSAESFCGASSVHRGSEKWSVLGSNKRLEGERVAGEVPDTFRA